MIVDTVYVREITSATSPWEVFPRRGIGKLCRSLPEARALAESLLTGDGRVVVWLRSHAVGWERPADLHAVFPDAELFEFEYGETDEHWITFVYAPRGGLPN